VLPIAFGGLLHFGTTPSTRIPSCCPCRSHGAEMLALFVFVGGLSAATGMVIVETIAVSTMICNDLVMPLLLRSKRFGGPCGPT
jgi:hypothetical protein